MYNIKNTDIEFGITAERWSIIVKVVQMEVTD